jgi:hypothetical protein
VVMTGDEGHLGVSDLLGGPPKQLLIGGRWLEAASDKCSKRITLLPARY